MSRTKNPLRLMAARSVCALATLLNSRAAAEGAGDALALSHVWVLMILLALCLAWAVRLSIKRKRLIDSLRAKENEQKRREEYDALTGLYSQHHFCEEARRLLSENPNTQYAIIRWDLSRFKVYNDLYGTDAGDRLLIGVAREQQARLWEGVLLSRLESDHFAYFLPAEKVDTEVGYRFLQEWLSQNDNGFGFSANIGIYLIENRELPISVMCDRALLALRTIKGNYHQHYAYYTDSMRDRLILEQQTVADMRVAIEQKQFVMFFQPQINYDTGKVFGAEALVRWNHPTRGMLPPGEFIPAFEKSGFITEMDRHIWTLACEYIRRWIDMGGVDIPITVSVNVSRIDIFNPALVDDIVRIAEEHGVPHDKLKLEITESAYMDNPEQLIDMVQAFKAHGFTVEMDDFGSGYSSLNTLKDVPVDILKLDLRFLSGDEHTGRGGNILSSVVRMARWLDMPVIAEGVETAEQAQYLKSIGCELMQGYLFARPMPAESFETFVREHDSEAIRGAGLDSMEDFDELWDPRSASAKLFTNFIGGAALLEYSCGNLEAIRVNDMCFRIFGLTREEYAKHGLKMLKRIHGDDLQLFQSCMEKAVQTRAEQSCDLRAKASNGKGVSWLRVRLLLIAKAERSELFFVSLENITEIKNLELDMRRQKERYRILLEDLNVATFDYDVKSDALKRTVYSASHGRAEKTIADYSSRIRHSSKIHPDSVPTILAALREAKARQISACVEYMARYTGDYRWVRARYVSLLDDTGEVYRVIGKIDDIQDVKEIEKHAREIKKTAENDALTGLLARAAFEAACAAYIGEDRGAKRGALVMIDEDNFKHANDTYGHIAGDALLSDAGRRILGSFRPEDICGRIGGDEFMVLIRSVSDETMLRGRMERLLAEIRKVTLPDGKAITGSLGCVTILPTDIEFQALYQQADDALYRAKKAGKDRYDLVWR